MPGQVLVQIALAHEAAAFAYTKEASGAMHAPLEFDPCPPLRFKPQVGHLPSGKRAAALSCLASWFAQPLGMNLAKAVWETDKSATATTGRAKSGHFGTYPRDTSVPRTRYQVVHGARHSLSVSGTGAAGIRGPQRVAS